LLLQQKTEQRISKFIQKLAGGYTHYFNNKYKRSGSLFQGKYKAKEIRSTYGLIKLSVYVNCNAEIHGIVKKENWPWSSYGEYINKSCAPTANGAVGAQNSLVLSEFRNAEEYINFCNELMPKIKAIKNLEKYELE